MKLHSYFIRSRQPCENTFQTYEQIQGVDDEVLDSPDDQHQSSSQGSQDEPYVNPINWEVAEKKNVKLVAPHKKSKQIKLKKQAPSEIASELKVLAG